MPRSPRAIRFLAVAASLAPANFARAATPVIVQNESGIEGLEESSVIYFPDSNTFQNDPTNFTSHLDEGGGMFRDTLRNEYPTPWRRIPRGRGGGMVIRYNQHRSSAHRGQGDCRSIPPAGKSNLRILVRLPHQSRILGYEPFLSHLSVEGNRKWLQRISTGNVVALQKRKLDRGRDHRGV